jgi:hypothetical protein
MKKDKRSIETLKLYGEECRKFTLSNPTAKEVQSANIKIVVAEPVWQSMRASYVGTWKDKGLMQSNVLEMREYLGSMNNPLRIRRVLNYLTGSAFRIGIISSPEISKLKLEKSIKIY